MVPVAFDINMLEQYERLEQAGMAAPIARAVSDFVLSAQKAGDFVTKSDLREYKAERASDLEKLEVGQDRKFDQIRHEVIEARQELKNDIEQVRNELKSQIDKVEHGLKSDIEQACNKLNNKINNLKFDMAKWMIGLFVAQTGLIIGLFLKMHGA